MGPWLGRHGSLAGAPGCALVSEGKYPLSKTDAKIQERPPLVCAVASRPHWITARESREGNAIERSVASRCRAPAIASLALLLCAICHSPLGDSCVTFVHLQYRNSALGNLDRRGFPSWPCLILFIHQTVIFAIIESWYCPTTCTKYQLLFAFVDSHCSLDHEVARA